jgi:hypothetical protein
LKHFNPSLGAAALGLLLLSGCAQSPIPVAGNFQLTEEKKVRSAGHWQLVSQDVAKETLKMLDAAGAAANARLTVLPPEKNTVFEQTFADMLTTELVHSGRRITVGPPSPLQVSYKVQVVKHNSPRPHFIPGIFTEITAGVFAAYGLRDYHIDTKATYALALAGVADYASSVNSGGPTATELVLTTTVGTPDQILSRKTDVYYLENEDATLFETKPEFKTMKVVNQ